MNNVTWEIVAYDPWFDLGGKNIIPPPPSPYYGLISLFSPE